MPGAISLRAMVIPPASPSIVMSLVTPRPDIVLAGSAAYVLGDQRFIVAGPYVVKIPAGVPHTFLNLGDQPFQLIAVFPDAQFSYEELGPNPLVAP
jgi:hypothetical protein